MLPIEGFRPRSVLLKTEVKSDLHWCWGCPGNKLRFSPFRWSIKGIEGKHSYFPNMWLNNSIIQCQSHLKLTDGMRCALGDTLCSVFPLVHRPGLLWLGYLHLHNFLLFSSCLILHNDTMPTIARATWRIIKESSWQSESKALTYGPSQVILTSPAILAMVPIIMKQWQLTGYAISRLLTHTTIRTTKDTDFRHCYFGVMCNTKIDNRKTVPQGDHWSWFAQTAQDTPVVPLLWIVLLSIFQVSLFV